MVGKVCYSGLKCVFLCNKCGMSVCKWGFLSLVVVINWVIGNKVYVGYERVYMK